MLVLSTVAPPPFTNTRPSASMAVPGQNMSCPVLVTSVSVAVSAIGSNSAVYVCVSESPPKANWLHDDQVTTLPFGSSAAATGTDGSVTGADHCPVTGGLLATGGTASTVNRPLVAVVQVPCSMTALLAVEAPRTRMHRPLFRLRTW